VYESAGVSLDEASKSW